jgi:hypothetical protein
MKKCICCSIEKELLEFYVHPKMRDGHLNKCKECCKKQADLREKKLRKDPEWCENERIRSKEKYYRLNYRETQFYQNKLKVYKNSKYKGLSKKLKLSSNENVHHWNYHLIEDVIILDRMFHRFVHRYLTLDKELLIFTSKEGDLLDSKEKHLEYIKKLNLLFNKDKKL